VCSSSGLNTGGGRGQSNPMEIEMEMEGGGVRVLYGNVRVYGLPALYSNACGMLHCTTRNAQRV
jgi:hypothetical protein